MIISYCAEWVSSTICLSLESPQCVERCQHLPCMPFCCLGFVCPIFTLWLCSVNDLTCTCTLLFFYRQGRKKHYLHREKARAQPEKYLTIMINGMDQSKTNVPLLLREPKSVQHLYRLRTHLSGAIIHTRSPHGKVIYTILWHHAVATR